MAPEKEEHKFPFRARLVELSTGRLRTVGSCLVIGYSRRKHVSEEEHVIVEYDGDHVYSRGQLATHPVSELVPWIHFRESNNG